MRKISLFLVLALCVGLSACSINLPGFSDSSKSENQGNQLIIAQTFTLKAGNVINGDMVAIGSSISLEPGSLINGNVQLFGSSLESRGIIKGNLNLFAGSGHLRNGSILNGDVNQLFNNVIIEKDAQVTGEVNTVSFPSAPAEQIAGLVKNFTNWLNSKNWLLWDILRVIVTSLLALLAGIFLKKRIMVMSQQIQTQPLLSWGTGLFLITLTPILGIILIITICFLPLGMLLIIALAFLYLTGWIMLGITTGTLMQSFLKTQWPLELQAFLGALVFGLATSLVGKIPCLGWTFNILLGCAGLGAMIITRFGSVMDRKDLIQQPTKIVEEPPKKSK
jgi:hypothetical protein